MIDERLKNMGIDCMALIKKKFSKEINTEQYYIGLLELHKKYPMSGHNPPLTKFQIEHYEEMREKNTSDKGVEYWDHLQPMNFQEAAEMFIRKWGKKIQREILPYKEEEF